MTKQQHPSTALLDAHARQAVPDDLDLWPAVRARIPRQEGSATGGTRAEQHRAANMPPAPRLRLAGLTLAGVLVIVALA